MQDSVYGGEAVNAICILIKKDGKNEMSFEKCKNCIYENVCDGLGMCRIEYEREIERALESDENVSN